MKQERQFYFVGVAQGISAALREKVVFSFLLWPSSGLQKLYCSANLFIHLYLCIVQFIFSM